MRRFRTLTLALTACFAAGATSAEVIQRYNTGTWVVQANAERGAFQNCTATGSYAGGAEVLFMLTRDVTWGVAITNPRWNWNAGSEGPVVYWVDAWERRNGSGRAVTKTQLLVLLADSSQLLTEIRQGKTMYFAPRGASEFSITLVGTSVALNELIGCVRRYR